MERNLGRSVPLQFYVNEKERRLIIMVPKK